MRLPCALVFGCILSFLHSSLASDCGLVKPGVCTETQESVSNPAISYTRTFPKCCKPTIESMTLRSGLRCLASDPDFLNSFAGCIKDRFGESTEYNAMKPADAMAKIGPSTFEQVLETAPQLGGLLGSLHALPNSTTSQSVPFDGDRWYDPGDAMAGFGQQSFFRYAVGAMPHGGRHEGVQDGDHGDAPARNFFKSYQNVGKDLGFPFITFWAGAANGLYDVLTTPTDGTQAANIGFFARGHSVSSVAELFKLVGKLGTNLFDEGQSLKAMHTDGQDVPLLHVRLDMEQEEGTLWPAPRDIPAKEQDQKICLAYKSLLGAPWTLKQLNAAWKGPLRENTAHLTWRGSNFKQGFESDYKDDGPFTQVLAGTWDGGCPASAPEATASSSVALVVSVVALLGFVVWAGVRYRRSKTDSTNQPLLA